MSNVRIADLKANLSRHLKTVRRGETITVLDRDTPVARIVPIETTANGLVIRHPPKNRRRLADIPLPRIDAESVQTIVKLAEAYRAMAQQQAATIAKPRAGSRRERSLYEEPEDVPAGPADSDVRQALLALDAAMLRLYDLPPRLERQLLDYFAGHERRGVGCDFQGYYPLGFTSYLPLHLVISDRFQRAAADATADRFKPGESAYVRNMLSAAVAAGSGEE